MSTASVRRVDHSALRTNQAFIIGLLVVAFIANLWPLVAAVALVMLVGTIIPEAGLFKLFYTKVLKPLKVVRPDVIEDNPEPHLFAQGLGGAFLVAGTISLWLGSAWLSLTGLTSLGWVLVWIVIALAGLNLFLGFCAGCFVYYQLNRLGVPGFTAAPIKRERAL